MVATKVLDLNVDQWRKMGGDFQGDIYRQISQIIHVLNKLGIDHGHSHNKNFCLKFARNSDGTVNYSVSPRVYIIDFDMARYNLT